MERLLPSTRPGPKSAPASSAPRLVPHQKGLDLCFSVVAFLIVASSPALGQVSTTCPPQTAQLTIAYGQRLTGCALGQTSSQNLYSFTGTANDLIRVSLWKQGGQGVPCLEVHDPTGTLVGGQGCLLDFSITLSQSGAYQIVARGQRASDSFQYDLRL